MDRKEFIKNCGAICLGGAFFTAALQSCGTIRNFNADIEGSDIIIPLSYFVGKQGFKKYIVISNEILQYPICVYRMSETNFSALWMSCTHQGAELQVFGDQLHCAAHGSEFSSDGNVQNGPADRKLRTFPVTVEEKQLKISLK